MDDSGEVGYSIILAILMALAVVIAGVLVLVALLLGGVVIGSTVRATNAQATAEALAAQATVATPLVEATPVAEPTMTADTAVAPIISAESTPFPTPAPSAQTAIGRIAVIDENQQLITINPDGSDRRQLSDPSDRRRYQFPAWSATERRIASIFTSRRDGNGIMIFDDSAESEPLSVYESNPAAPIYLYWSPNSELISFIEPGRENLNFNVVSAVASAEVRSLGRGTPFYWDWADDSSKILIHSGGTVTGDSVTAIINTATDVFTPLEFTGSGFFQSPDFSPDGRKLAYAQGQTPRNRELIISGQSVRDLVMIEHNGFVALEWSPLGDQLAFISNELPNARSNSYGPLKLVSAEGTVTVIEDSTVFAFFWSPNGRRIAYLTPPTLSDSQLEASLRGRRANPAKQSQEAVRFALWVVDTATGEREQLGLFVPTDIFLQQFLPFFDQYAHSHSLWSPQSEAILFPVIDDGVDKIYQFFVDGQLPTVVTEGSIGFWSHQ